jgi:hypothetical protein
MVWIFLLLALAVMYVALTQQLSGVDERLQLYWKKVLAAFQYFKEDVADVEAELKEKAAAKSASTKAEPPQ